jgi:hypothetical protein
MAVAEKGRRVGEGQRRTGGAVDATATIAYVRQWETKMSLYFLFIRETAS